MTEKEYFAQIREIRRHISAGRLECAEEQLTKMHAYKPVRLLWFVAKAEYVLAKEGDPSAALRVLDGERYLEKKFFFGKDYPGLKACMKFRIDTFRQMGRERDAIREEYCYQRACGKRGSRLEEALANALEAFADDAENSKALSALGDAFYHTADMISYFIVRMVMMQRGLLEHDDRSEWFYQTINFGYLEERLRVKGPQTFILIMDEHLGQALEVLGFLLHSLGHKVYLISPPLTFETEEQLELSDTLTVSLDSAEQYPDMCVIPPVVLTREGKPYGDNRDYIIDHICRNESGNDQALLLCSGVLLDTFYRDGPLRGRLGRLSPYETDFQEEKLQFGWVGSYLSYISNIYDYDVRVDLEAEPEVDFSIVVPARNSAKTLRYTLQTCLNQQYTGSYEIVVSDNSTEGNTEVHDLCQELDDPRIRYVKAPHDLTLPRSFEFGYLQARGEFILSIGSDDGILPWALGVLKNVINRFPNEEIIQWERGFYAWPGFNGGQENMFQIPRKYEKGKINVYFETTVSIFDQVAENQQQIYLMPLLYINSGFRRGYLKTMLKKTGKLLDGCNQDLQTGIINCCINKRILKIAYPFTIAGMSSNSIGYVVSAVANKEGEMDEARQELRQWENKGVWTFDTRARRFSPHMGVDSSALYFTLSKAVAEGLLPEAEADRILDWQTAVVRIFEATLPLREDYELCVYTAQFTAQKLGTEQKNWFQKLIGQLLTPRVVDEAALEQKLAQKTYQEGEDSFGGEVLDASNFGVKNILEAVSLFAERTGLL